MKHFTMSSTPLTYASFGGLSTRATTGHYCGNWKIRSTTFRISEICGGTMTLCANYHIIVVIQMLFVHFSSMIDFHSKWFYGTFLLLIFNFGKFLNHLEKIIFTFYCCYRTFDILKYFFSLKIFFTIFKLSFLMCHEIFANWAEWKSEQCE